MTAAQLLQNRHSSASTAHRARIAGVGPNVPTPCATQRRKSRRRTGGWRAMALRQKPISFVVFRPEPVRPAHPRTTEPQ